MDFEGCSYGVPYCDKCTSSISCDRCTAGYYGLKQGAPRSSLYRCAKKCPQRFIPVTVPGYGQRCQPSGELCDYNYVHINYLWLFFKITTRLPNKQCSFFVCFLVGISSVECLVHLYLQLSLKCTKKK